MTAMTCNGNDIFNTKPLHFKNINSTDVLIPQNFRGTLDNTFQMRVVLSCKCTTTCSVKTLDTCKFHEIVLNFVFS